VFTTVHDLSINRRCWDHSVFARFDRLVIRILYPNY